MAVFDLDKFRFGLESNILNQQYEEAKNKMLRKNTLIASLYETVHKNQLEIYYQPQIDLSTGAIIGVEALLRWNHPLLGKISPVEFIPLLEENNLINEVTEWVLSTACVTIKKLSSFLNQPLKLSVNLSVHQLIPDYLPQMIKGILTKVDFPPNCLTVELVETSLIKDFPTARKIFNELAELGISIALDDFGTGYSSLSYLSQCAFDIVKIDKSFVNDLHQCSRKRNLVEGIIKICTTMNIKITAEGIENQVQFDFLYNNKCDYGQGYLISKPLAIDDLRNFILHLKSA